ncbi:MAG TPA: hypothetical protein VF120_02345 [Ktedonobacterales bacterium]
MIFERAILGQELILLSTIGLAMGLIYTYLWWRAQLDLLRHVWLPSLIWTITGTLDALVTMVGTWGDPLAEENPLLRPLLVWDGWIGQLIYTFIWVLFWAALVFGLEELRRRVGGASGIHRIAAYLLGAVQLLILYRLALWHFAGFLSWTPYYQPIARVFAFFEEHTPWLFSDSLVGYVLDLGTALGAICVALHLAVAALLRRMGIWAPVSSQAVTSQAVTSQTQGELGTFGKAG